MKEEFNLQETIIRKLIYPAFQLFAGRNTMDLLKEWETFHKAPPEAIRAYQLQRLRTVLGHAKNNVPYYRKALGELGFDPGDLQTLEDMKRLPLLSKEVVKDRLPQFLTPGSKGRVRTVRTGGSTGEPMKYYMGQDAFAANQAVIWRSRRWWGLDIGQPNVLLWGHSASFHSGLRGRLAKKTRPWKERILNRRLFPAYDLSPENMLKFWARAQKLEPRFIRGYTTALYFWAGYLKEKGFQGKLDSLRAVITTSEMLYDWQRDLIEEVFMCPVVNEYGANETGIMAYSCPAGKLHVMDENVFLEVVKPENSGEGDLGEVVVTQLHHLEAPLIRYRMGDVAEGISRGCACGSNLRVLDGLQGRVHDLILTPEGQYIHGQLFTHIFEHCPGIEKFQVRQTQVDRVLVKLVVDESFSKQQEERLTGQFLEKTDSGIGISFQYVDEIQDEGSGKYRWIKSDVPKREYQGEFG